VAGVRGAAATAAAVLVMLAAGCGGGNGPPGATVPPNLVRPSGTAVAAAPSAAPATTTRPAVASITPAPVPSSAAPPSQPPVRPAPRTGPDPAGGLEFMRAFEAESRRAWRTGDVSSLVTYSKPTCNCRRAPNEILSFYRLGWRLLETENRVLSLKVTRNLPYYLVIERVAETRAQVWRDPEGKIRRTPDEFARHYFRLNFLNGRWIIDSTGGETRREAVS
jgi:hypothetical protein